MDFKNIVWAGPVGDPSGYGVSGRDYIKALLKHSVIFHTMMYMKNELMQTILLIKLSWLVQERAITCTCVPDGLCRLKPRSLIHVWVPFRFKTLTSTTVPSLPTVKVELMEGVPLIGMVWGTSVLT